jgi:hypothetical protein
MFEGMSGEFFCSTLNQAFASMGMTKEDYIALVQQSIGMFPADMQADFQEFIQMIQACP